MVRTNFTNIAVKLDHLPKVRGDQKDIWKHNLYHLQYPLMHPYILYHELLSSALVAFSAIPFSSPTSIVSSPGLSENGRVFTMDAISPQRNS